MTEKLKAAELQEEQKFMEKQKAAEYKVETLWIQQQLARTKILEQFNEEGEDKVSKNSLHAEDRNIPLQYQKGYEYFELATKLTCQSSVHHSLPAGNRPSNDLSDEYRSSRLSYDIPLKSEFNHRGRHLGEMNFSAKRELLDNYQTATDVLCWLLQEQAAPEVEMEVFNDDLLNFKYFVSVFEKLWRPN